MSVETSIVVVFGDGATGGNVVVELDPEHANNLDADGELKSTFDSVKPDVPVLLIHMDDTLTLTSIVPDSGTVTPVSGNTAKVAIAQTRVEDFSMPNESEKSGISYSDTSIVSQTTNGTRGGTVAISGDDFVYASGDIPFSGKAVLNVTFQYQYYVNAATPIVLDADGNFKIIIYIYVDLI